ncbi:hypothetical protein Hanom_Chr06g00569951 [Helianthus anomalus]
MGLKLFNTLNQTAPSTLTSTLFQHYIITLKLVLHILIVLNSWCTIYLFLFSQTTTQDR